MDSVKTIATIKHSLQLTFLDGNFNWFIFLSNPSLSTIIYNS